MSIRSEPTGRPAEPEGAPRPFQWPSQLLDALEQGVVALDRERRVTYNNRRIEELLAGGRTLFFVSHNEKDLRRFCTRGLYLDGGNLVLDAPIDEVLARYNSDYPI